MWSYLKRRLALLQSGENARFFIFRQIARVLMPEYRLHWYQLDWRNDADFNQYLSFIGESHGLNAGRRWMVHQLLRLVHNVPGDTAECGVFRGATSFLICKANEQSVHPRTHFMFDSFEGISAPGVVDGDYWQKGDLSADEKAVRDTLQTCRNFELLKGWIPDRFNDVSDRRFSFVHIDVDLYEPTLEAINFFYPRLNPGGILVIDDVGFSTCPGATRAIRDASDKIEDKLIALPHGGGFLIKNQTVSRLAPLF